MILPPSNMVSQVNPTEEQNAVSTISKEITPQTMTTTEQVMNTETDTGVPQPSVSPSIGTKAIPEMIEETNQLTTIPDTQEAQTQDLTPNTITTTGSPYTQQELYQMGAIQTPPS